MSSESIRFILVVAVVGFPLVLAVEGILGLAHKLNQPDAGVDTAPAIGLGLKEKLLEEARGIFDPAFLQERENSNPRPLVLESNGICLTPSR